MRTTLETLLGEDPRLLVAGSARDGVEAVAMAKSLRPDVITMDVVMPELDGVDATARIMAESPARILVISSYVDHRHVDLTFRAIGAGALEVIAKPTNSRVEELRAWGQRVCDSIVLLAEVPVVTRRRLRTAPLVGGSIDVIGIVASTGGPPALAQILSALPADLPIPILVAQHIGDGFTEGLIRWLSNVSKLKVLAAVERGTVRPGHVYFAPDRRNLEVGADGLLHTPAGGDRHTPSGNHLLASLARFYGSRAGGLVMTGMGDDGASGLLAIRDAGGVTFAQSQQSCVVFGMPQAAVARGATTELRPLESIAAEILELASYPVRRGG
jgi:two-component system chemotaxis response regulator CheB